MKRKILLSALVIFCSCSLFSQNNPKRDSLFRCLKEAKSDSGVAIAFNDIARELFMPNVPDSMIYYGKKGVAATENKSWKSNLLNTVGVGFYYKSEFDSSLRYYLESLKIREAMGKEKMIISSMNNIAVIYQIKGDLEKALEYYFKTLRFREKAKDSLGIANICENIANLYMERSDNRQALHYQHRALMILNRLKDTVGIAEVYLNMADSYNEMSVMDSAFYYVSKSIPVMQKHDLKNYLAQAYNILGIYYSKAMNHQLAVSYFTKAKDCYKIMGDAVGAAGEQLNIGVSKLEIKDYSGAYTDCNASLPILEEAQHYDKLRHCYSCLYRSLKGLEKHKEALLYYEKFIALKDTITGRERIKEITKIEMNHEYTKKTEIADLKHQKDIEIREQEKKNQRLFIYFIMFGLIISVFMVFFIINRLKISRQQSKIIEQQRNDVQAQKEIIEDKQKEIIDSINYAKRIQNTLLAHSDFINANIPNNFVFFKPKDIVSGDFYWAAKKGDLFYLAVCDSTGHGVPGAFMSLLNIGFLSEAINEKNMTEPHLILNYVRQRLIDGISKEGQKDGFDGILVCINTKTFQINYAAAHNAPIIIRNNEVIELPKDKMPVGKGERTESFTLHSIDLQKNDSLYLYTDGYADQFGGPKGKKYLYKKLNEFLKGLSNDAMKEREQKLNSDFTQWKGELEQVDDVLIIGFTV